MKNKRETRSDNIKEKSEYLNVVSYFRTECEQLLKDNHAKMAQISHLRTQLSHANETIDKLRKELLEVRNNNSCQPLEYDKDKWRG